MTTRARNAWHAAPLFLAGAHLLFSFWWISARLGTFYYYRADDAARINQALKWAQHPNLGLGVGWLPLGRYLLGLALMAFPDPYRTPLYFHALMTSAALCLLGLASLELFPEEPAAGLVAMLAAVATPFFEKLGLSAGAEVDCWFFAVLNLYFWVRYRRTGSLSCFWMSALCLALGSMTRYEAWFYNLAFMAATLPGAPASRLRRGGYACLALTLVALYIGYQEYHLSEYRAEELVSSGLSSYALLRVAGTMPLDCVRSFFAPATSLWRVSPPGEVVVLVALVFLWVRKPSLRWYPGSVGLSAVLLSIVAGTVWFFPWPRLVIVFYLMSAPAVAYLLLSLTNRNRRSLMLSSAIAVSVFSLTRNMPRNETAKRYSPPGVFDLGRDMHAAEEMTGLRPKLLVETSIMNDYYGAIFMFVAMDVDRLVEAEPGYFRKRSILEAKKFFSDNGIGWIVARSNDASAVLCSVPLVAQSGPVKIFAYGLPPEIKSAFRPRTP